MLGISLFEINKTIILKKDYIKLKIEDDARFITLYYFNNDIDSLKTIISIKYNDLNSKQTQLLKKGIVISTKQLFNFLKNSNCELLKIDVDLNNNQLLLYNNIIAFKKDIVKLWIWH